MTHFYSSTTPGQGNYDFATPTDLNGLILWNLNITEDDGAGGLTDRSNAGVNQFRIRYRINGGPVLSLGEFNADQASASGDTPGQFFSFGPAPLVDVTQIQFQYLSNHGGTGFGLGELRFTAPEVPEPASLILLGLGSLCMLGRQRG